MTVGFGITEGTLEVAVTVIRCKSPVPPELMPVKVTLRGASSSFIVTGPIGSRVGGLCTTMSTKEFVLDAALAPLPSRATTVKMAEPNIFARGANVSVRALPLPLRVTLLLGSKDWFEENAVRMSCEGNVSGSVTVNGRTSGGLPGAKGTLVSPVIRGASFTGTTFRIK